MFDLGFTQLNIFNKIQSLEIELKYTVLITTNLIFMVSVETIDQTPDSIVDHIFSKAEQAYNPSHYGQL